MLIFSDKVKYDNWTSLKKIFSVKTIIVTCRGGGGQMGIPWSKPDLIWSPKSK